MLINQFLPIVSCVLIILPVLIEGNHRNPDSRNQRDAKFRVGNKLVTKRQLHGHIIETPISEEVALIEQQPQPHLHHQHQPVVVTHPSSVEIIQEHHQFDEIPRYSSHPPTDSIIATHGPLITATTPPHHHHHHQQPSHHHLNPQHLHLLPLVRPVVNPIHLPVDVQTSTKVVEVSAINSDTGHSHRLGAFAVQPLIDHLHLGRIKNLPHHHHHHPQAAIISLRGQPKSRVEMFQQQSIETLDPIEEIGTPSDPNQRSPSNQPSGYFEQQSIDYPRNSRLSSPQSTKFTKFNQQPEPIVSEKIVYTPLSDGHPHVHPLQPARLIIEDNHHSHNSPQSAALIVETPNHQHHLVELTPTTTQHQSHSAVKTSHSTRCRQNRI
ncbi:LIM domain-containing protein A-like [Panonychus citri]|uniref:LIM domain-containing protein A-like n=1 Tax=Panonychus citri TaxID=50023 RepID=UPI0023082A86|nr:LIM domain-containing protein A-like [Panonychus citri]